MKDPKSYAVRLSFADGPELRIRVLARDFPGAVAAAFGKARHRTGAPGVHSSYGKREVLIRVQELGEPA